MKDDTLLMLGLAGVVAYLLFSTKSSAPPTAQETASAQGAVDTYTSTPLGTSENVKASTMIQEYADKVKASGGTNADVVNRLSAPAQSSGFVDRSGSYVPAVKQTQQVSYGQYTKAPITATVEKNAQGGYNIRL